MTAPNTMTMAEYAAHRKVSVVAVSKAITQGRLVEGVSKMVREDGRVMYAIDPVLCDAQWINNAKRQSAVRRTSNPPPIPVGRPSVKHSDAIKAIKADAKAQRELKQSSLPKAMTQNDLSGAQAAIGEPARKKAASASVAPSQGQASADMPLGYRKSLADTLKAEAQAEREQIALRKDKRELVEVEKIEDEYASMVAKARDLLLHIPKSFQVTHMEADPKYSAWLEERIEAILNDLSSGVGNAVSES